MKIKKITRKVERRGKKKRVWEIKRDPKKGEKGLSY